MSIRNKKKTKIAYARMIESLVTMLVCTAIIIYSTYSWFGMNTEVTANQMSISAADGQTDLRVYAKSDATDEALTVNGVTDNSSAERLVDLKIDSLNTKLEPGSFGQFTFWAESEDADTFTMQLAVRAGGIITARDSDGKVIGIENAANNGFRTIAKDNTDIQALGLRYLQGHIFFFRSFNSTTGVYSGWINPFADNQNTANNRFSLTETDGDIHKGSYTIYWLWVDSYYRLRESSNISSDDIDTISEYFFDTVDGVQRMNAAAQSYLFDTRGNSIETPPSDTQLSHYYDFGDENIGLNIEHIYFDLSFTA